MYKLLHTELGRKIISIVIGLGFAGMFRRVCEKNNCLIIKGPKTHELAKYYKIDKKCYKYNPYPINCPK
tara:strand:+ start:83 stop:289 length:207 start_codon:yes stop_codon:yes gene_type:complete